MYVRWNANHPKDFKGRKLVTDIEDANLISIVKSDKRIVVIDHEGAFELARNLIASIWNVDPHDVEISLRTT